MKIRLAVKIMKYQPENDPIGRKSKGYWVKRWDDHEEFPPIKRDHRIDKSIILTDKFINRNGRK